MPPILHLLTGFAAAAQSAPLLTAEQAIARQQEQVRQAVNGKCRTESEEIVVCGKRPDNERYVPNFQYRGPDFGYQSEASLFELKIGNAAIGCCSIPTSTGTGVGLNVRISF